MIAIYIIGFITIVFWLLPLIWNIKPFKLYTCFCHDILGWHKPDDTHEFDGCSEHSHCRFCGKEIMQDSQGNWFTF